MFCQKGFCLHLRCHSIPFYLKSILPKNHSDAVPTEQVYEAMITVLFILLYFQNWNQPWIDFMFRLHIACTRGKMATFPLWCIAKARLILSFLSVDISVFSKRHKIQHAIYFREMSGQLHATSFPFLNCIERSIKVLGSCFWFHMPSQVFNGDTKSWISFAFLVNHCTTTTESCNNLSILDKGFFKSMWDI